MAITENTTLNTILWKFSDDGVAVECWYSTKYYRDGVLIPQAMPTNATRVPTIEELEVLMGEVAANVTTQLAGYQTQVATLEAQISELQANNADLANRIMIGNFTPAVSNAHISVTAAQARMALARADKLDTVLTFIQSLPAANDIAILWEYTNSFERDNPVLVGVGEQLGMSNTEVDDLFALARTL